MNRYKRTCRSCCCSYSFYNILISRKKIWWKNNRSILRVLKN